MTLETLPRGWWGYHWSPPHPRSIVELIAAGSLDVELAALLWLLVEGRLPVIIAAGPPLAGKSTTLTALLDFLPSDTRPVYLGGWGEEFGWLPEASELGWRADSPLRPPGAGSRPTDPAPSDVAVAPVHPGSSYLLAAELSDHLPVYTWGERARVFLRAASRGYGIGTTVHAESLAEVLAQLAAPPVSLAEDELRWLGIVLVVGLVDATGRPLGFADLGDAELGPFEPGLRRRIVAAHYLRPPERDAGGHVQRRPPAVLATWDPRTDGFAHFAWGVTAELAERVRRTPAAFEREQARRAAALTDLVRRGETKPSAVAVALRAVADSDPPGARLAPSGRAAAHLGHDHPGSPQVVATPSTAALPAEPVPADPSTRH